MAFHRLRMRPDELRKVIEERIANMKTHSLLELGLRGISLEDLRVIVDRLIEGDVMTNQVALTVNNLGDEGATMIAEAMSKCSRELCWDLYETNITMKGARTIANSLGNNKTLVLNISNNPIGPEGAEAFAEIFSRGESPFLRTFNIEGCGIRFRGASAILTALANHPLQELIIDDLYPKGRSDDERLISGIARCRLNYLEISKGDTEGIKALSTGLRHNSTLKALALSYQNEREDARLLYDVVTRKVVSKKLFDPLTKYVPREFNLMGGNMPMDVEASSIGKYCLELLLTTHHLIPQELRENGDIHRAIQKFLG